MTALIGSPGVSSTAGAADVFTAASEGSWSSSTSPAAILSYSGGASLDRFGYSVAISGDGTTALLAAPFTGTRVGTVYVFHVANVGSWSTSSTPTAILTNAGGGAEDGFGLSVAISSDGTTALIGAYGVTSYTGAAYVFHVAGQGSWSSSSAPTATLTNGAGAFNDSFGDQVAISADGTNALIGADGVKSNTGAAYVFHTTGEGSWSTSSAPTATLTNTHGAASDLLSSSVAISADGTTTLIGADGVSSGTGASYIFHSAVPTVTALSPNKGPTAGGTVVTISGANLTGVTAVHFGAVPATIVKLVSASAIEVHSPKGSGTVDITVTTLGGTSAKSAADRFTFVPPPTVTKLSPNKGPTAGGTLVTISGANLAGVTAVHFGAAPATIVKLVSASAIEVHSPKGSGTVDVTVTTPGGTSPKSAGDRFTFVPPPTVTKLSPNKGPTAGGTLVTITGANLAGVTEVHFGAAPATIVKLVSASAIEVHSPKGSGTVDVTVTTLGGTSAKNAADRFTY
jgi:S-adenosylmethionine/arginine decarboxylase-like enzyme